MSSHQEHASDPKKEARTYVATLVTLLILTIITVAASYIDFGQGNIVIALTIATIKATIVALFFMHLIHDRPINAVIAIAGFIFLGLLLLFTLIDTGTRIDPNPQILHPPVMVSPDGKPLTGGAPAAAPSGPPAEAPKE